MGRVKIKSVSKPWGFELIWAHTDKYVGKILHINHGHRLSLQYHKKKSETIMVQSGVLTFTHNGQEMQMEPGDSFEIQPGQIHRMEAKQGEVIILEVSTPELEDVVRIEDNYGREKKTKS